MNAWNIALRFFTNCVEYIRSSLNWRDCYELQQIQKALYLDKKRWKVYMVNSNRMIWNTRCLPGKNKIIVQLSIRWVPSAKSIPRWNFCFGLRIIGYWWKHKNSPVDLDGNVQMYRGKALQWNTNNKRANMQRMNLLQGLQELEHSSQKAKRMLHQAMDIIYSRVQDIACQVQDCAHPRLELWIEEFGNLAIT